VTVPRTPGEHLAEAQRLVNVAVQGASKITVETATYLYVKAQVHATMAVAPPSVYDEAARVAAARRERR
jgi:hypothetical protein